MVNDVDAFDAVFCFVVYGRDYEKYYAPLVEFASKLIRPGEVCAVACCEMDREFVEATLGSFSEVRIVSFPDEYLQRARLLRFLLPLFVEADIFHFRDSDSIVSLRERQFLDAWAILNRDILVIRDHPLHYAPILAGMVSLKRSAARILAESLDSDISTVSKESPYYDQLYLTQNLYIRNTKSIVVFTSCWGYFGERIVCTEPQVANFIGMPVWWGIDEIRSSFSRLPQCSGIRMLFFIRPLSQFFQRWRFVLFVYAIAWFRKK